MIRRCGPPAICSLIHALKKGGTRQELMKMTGQSEGTVAEWIRHFRFEGLVRVYDVSLTGRESYRWIERGDPTRDHRKVRMTLQERSAAARNSK